MNLMKYSTLIILLISFLSCGNKYKPSSDLEIINQFSLAKPQIANLAFLNIVSTYYYLPILTSRQSGFQLRDIRGNSFGVMLTQKEWCSAALEGSVYINNYKTPNNQIKGQTFNFHGTSSSNYVNCINYGSIALGKTKFKLSTNQFGDGVSNFKLVPFRTIAVDPRFIEIGSAIFIPAARGVIFTDTNGKQRTHDGYFFAADRGGMITGSHIDVFIGISKKNPFKFISRNSADAYIVEEISIINNLKKLHLSKI